MYFMYELIKNNVAVYAAHTNLDAAKGGVNDVLAAKLGLDKVETIPRPECPEQGLARIGFLTKPIALKSFATKVKKALEADGVAYTDGGQDCYKVAVVGGGGADFMEAAIEAGADTLVTGDVKYHVAQKALNLGLNIIDGGHQFTERPVLDQLEAVIKGWAEDSDRDIEIVRAEEEVILQHL
jgi:dinuclear metal center YbgI/SA1388 family protein